MSSAAVVICLLWVNIHQWQLRKFTLNVGKHRWEISLDPLNSGIWVFFEENKKSSYYDTGTWASDLE